MGESILGVLQRKFQADAERQKESMADGQAKDWGAYRQQVGVHHGIMKCLAEVIALEKNLMEGEYDD